MATTTHRSAARAATLLFALVIALSFLAASATVEADASRGAKVDAKPNLENVVADTKSPSDKPAEETKGTKYSFQAEVNRLMDIIIHSLYSNRDIFLRELISNGSDAIDKLRFLALTDPDLRAKVEQEPAIHISTNQNDKSITISDQGIGMTREDLINHLGTIARSGTAAFLEKVTKNPAAESKNLIGQFGVGFYSSFLVADKVKVITKTVDGQQLVWESRAAETFTIYEDDSPQKMTHGTKVVLYLKEDAFDYLKQDKIKELIKKYSQFINFPIYLEEIETVEVEVPDDSPDEEVVDLDDDSAADDTPKPPKTKTEKQEVAKFVLQNSDKPIWLRDPAEVTDDEYNSFFRVIAKDFSVGEPTAHTHFKAEGEIEFRSILYIPPTLPQGFLQNEDAVKDNVKLYVRRVLVTDVFQNAILPRYLSFMTGVVDSDDLPINISREMLQKSKLLDVIKRKLVRKALEMIKNIMGWEPEKKKDEEKAEDDSDGVPEPKEAKAHPYIKFWRNFGKAIKAGILEDSANRQRLAKLLRYKTSKTNTSDTSDWASLDDYLDRMKEDQEFIYYHSGESLEQIENSPFLEKLLEKGYEVLYLSEPIDEHVVAQMPDYEGVKFMSISKDNFKFGEADQKVEKEKASKARKHYKPLLKFLKEKLGDKVHKVKLSTRLSNSPCVLSADQFGYSAQMEIIMRAQAFADPDNFKFLMPKQKVMEINPNHRVVKGLLALVNEKPESQEALDLAHLLYDSSLITSGYYMHDQKDFAERMDRFLVEALKVKLGEKASAMDAEIVVEDDDEDDASKASKKAEAAEKKDEKPAEEAAEDKTSEEVKEEEAKAKKTKSSAKSSKKKAKKASEDKEL